MGLPVFFKQNKHKQFHYIPRYFDPLKEELEERVRRIEEEEGVRPVERASGIRKGQMRSYYDRQKHERSFSGIRLLIIMAALGLIVYYMFFR